MVGQLIRLKAKMVWNTMVKQTLVLVLSIIGVLYFGGVGAFVYVGLTMSAQSAIAPSMSFYLTLIGPAVFIGWILLPVLFGALDNTLAPDRLSPYVGPTRRLGVGLVAAGGVGFGGALSTMVLLMPAWFNAWRGVPLHALGSLAAALTTLALSLIWGRAVATWFAVRINSAGRRDLVAIIGTMAFFIIVTPMGVWINYLARNFSEATMNWSTDVALWSPFGAPFGFVESLAAARYAEAGARLVIVVATAVAGWLLWMRVLQPVMSGSAQPIAPEAQRAIEEGRHLVDESKAVAERVQRVNESRGAGLAETGPYLALGMGPRSATLAARTLHYWFRDPRIMMNLPLMLIFPLMAYLFKTQLPPEAGGFNATLFFYLVPITTGLVVGALMQYDSTGAWIVISSGMKGREERLGRLAGSLPVLIIQVASYLVYDAVARSDAYSFVFHQVMGFVLFSGAAATTLSFGAWWVYPVQPPGASPLSTKGTGSFLTTMLIQLGSFLGTAVVQAPSFVLIVLGEMGTVPVAASMAFSVVWSVVVLAAGVVIGGKVWDKHAVDALTTIRSWPGH